MRSDDDHEYAQVICIGPGAPTDAAGESHPKLSAATVRAHSTSIILWNYGIVYNSVILVLFKCFNSRLPCNIRRLLYLSIAHIVFIIFHFKLYFSTLLGTFI